MKYFTFFTVIFYLILFGLNPNILADIMEQCDNPDSDIVQEKYTEIYEHIVQNGFTANQLDRALMAVKAEINAAPSQKRGQQYFEKRVQIPLILLLRDSDIAQTFREKFRQMMALLKNEETPAPDRTILSVEDLSTWLTTTKARMSEIDALKQIDLAKAMAEKRRLNLDENIRILEGTLELVYLKNDRGELTRKTALGELLRALQSSSDLMLAKCKLWQALQEEN